MGQGGSLGGRIPSSFVVLLLNVQGYVGGRKSNVASHAHVYSPRGVHWYD